MSRQQWAHGYYKGIEAAKNNSNGLLGLWFHSFSDDGYFDWQGEVIKDLENGRYLVQLYEWAMGYPSTQKIINVDDMKDWDFYKTDEDMRDRYDRAQTSGKSRFIRKR